MKFCRLILPLFLVYASGCGGFAARRMAQAPNSYPRWLAPKAPVTLEFSDEILTAFTNQYLKIRSPAARIRYRVIEPAGYQFRWTNRLDEAKGQLDLSFSASAGRPERTNQWTHQPRGTVVLLHGYGDAGIVMLPWGLLLAEEGWRCVLVDLRGHGKSGGKQIYFGIQEVSDLRELLDQLDQQDGIAFPVSVVGHSYGAVLALRWKKTDPRLDKVVAISPYADLSSVVLNVCRQYARWMPTSFIKAGLRKLPDLLKVEPGELNPSCWMDTHGQAVLFIAGGGDKIVPLDQVERLHKSGGTGSTLIVVPNAAHEPLPLYLDDLADPIIHWLK